MNNVHRLIVPERNPACAPTVRQPCEVLILPCVRYERIDGGVSRRSSVPAPVFEPLRQDLTA